MLALGSKNSAEGKRESDPRPGRGNETVQIRNRIGSIFQRIRRTRDTVRYTHTKKEIYPRPQQTDNKQHPTNRARESGRLRARSGTVVVDDGQLEAAFGLVDPDAHHACEALARRPLLVQRHVRIGAQVAHPAWCAAEHTCSRRRSPGESSTASGLMVTLTSRPAASGAAAAEEAAEEEAAEEAAVPMFSSVASASTRVSPSHRLNDAPRRSTRQRRATTSTERDADQRRTRRTAAPPRASGAANGSPVKQRTSSRCSTARWSTCPRSTG